MPANHYLLLLALCLATTVSVTAQRTVKFGVGMASSRHVVNVVPAAYASEFTEPNGRLGAYVEAELALLAREKLIPSLVTRVAMEGTNGSRSWPEVSSLRAAIGSRLEFKPTNIIGVIGGVNTTVTMRENFVDDPLPLETEAEPNRLDVRAEIGLTGHFGRVRVLMLIERGLAFRSNNILLYSTPEKINSFVPDYYTGTMRFGIAYELQPPEQ